MGKLREQIAAAHAAKETFEQRHSQLLEKSSRADREQSLTLLLAGLAAFYLAVRFGATKQLDALGEFTGYIFEIGLVAYAMLLLRPKLSVKALAKPLTLVIATAALASGFAILKIARLSNIAVPLDVHDHQTVFFLLAVAPVLEELIFRFLLFKPIERLFNVKHAMIATTILFSYSHLHSIWFVPAEYDKFIIYQTLYTLPLGLACAWIMRRQKSLLSSMLVHACFNAGFFIAFWV